MKRFIDLNDFERRSDFYDIQILISIKSFDLQAIRKRYLDSKKNKIGKAGSVHRRKPGLGGIAELHLEGGKIQSEDVFVKIPEPRAIAQGGDCFAFANDKTVFCWKEDGLRKLENPWFSYIHTIDFDPSGKYFMVSSSGLDCILEFELSSFEKTWEWFAWENGFHEGFDPISNQKLLLTRAPEQSKKWLQENKHHLLIADPVTQSLPTVSRAAFINSVSYKDEANILATFFHEGCLYEIQKETGTSLKLIDGLRNPHGGRVMSDGVMATSTARGEVHIQVGNELDVYAFKNIPGKPLELADGEWLQNSVPIGNLIVSIDSNRCCFVIWDIENRLMDCIGYNENWAVQDLVSGSLDQEERQEIGEALNL